MALPSMKSPIEEQLRPITFEEYRALPDDGPRYELIYGELIMSEAPKSMHQRVSFRLASALQDYVDDRELGEVFMAPFDVRLSKNSVVEPDVLFISTDHRDRIGEDYCDGPPDLIIEVLSPSNQRMDLVRKRVLYAEHGVLEYWIVDPEARSVSVNLLRGDQYDEHVVAEGDLGSETFPGFAFDFHDIFSIRPWMTKRTHANKDEPAT